MNNKQNTAEQEIQCKEDNVSTGDQKQNGETGVENTDPAALMSELAEKTRQVDELGNRFLRLQADFDNFRRRTRQEKEEASQFIANGIITKLLPILDNFERALNTGGNQDAGQLLAGMELVNRQFTQILEGMGVKPVVAVGSQFDPNLHEAVMRVEDSSQPDGLIVEELQKGYMAHEKLLRPSMVKVVNNS
jgi:molecular chaperone GrpE